MGRDAFPDLLNDFRRSQIAKREINHRRVKVIVFEDIEKRFAAVVFDHLYVRSGNRGAHTIPEPGIGAHHNQFLNARLSRHPDYAEGCGEVGLLHRLLREGHGAQSKAPAAVIVTCNYVNGDLPGTRVMLKPVDDSPAHHIGESYIQSDRGRLKLSRERERRVSPERHEALPRPRESKWDRPKVSPVCIQKATWS